MERSRGVTKEIWFEVKEISSEAPQILGVTTQICVAPKEIWFGINQISFGVDQT